ncbi:MAG TPA: hemerythrin domain-containing protein [Acidothermaceae bacterium]|jgi:iron-sulfur cluster repair protein YtfE (RIC family)
MSSTDAIVLLKNDHKEVKALFRQFEKAGDDAVARKGQLVSKMIELLTTHTYLENNVMYPEVRTLLPDLEDDVLESYEEHHVADILCFELYEMKPDHEHFTAKATVLIENTEHHMGEEEDDWFPKVRAGLSRSQLQDMGARMLALKAKAPKKPTDPRAIKSAVKAVSA